MRLCKHFRHNHGGQVTDLEFRRYDAEAARAIRETVALIHREAYAAAIERGDPFETGDEPMRRFFAYTVRRGFELVVAYLEGEPIGQTWGWPLSQLTEWWRDLPNEPEPGFIQEDGKRTFALSELMVRRSWAGQGVGHALHDALLGARTETRATLLVRPDNTNAYRAYLRWGWRKVAEMRPNVPHAPQMDVLILPLPLGQGPTS
jgi:ribosomal protein S18 acetylase RimI-like enzyme